MFFRLQALAGVDTMAWPRPLRQITCGGTPGVRQLRGCCKVMVDDPTRIRYCRNAIIRV